MSGRRAKGMSQAERDDLLEQQSTALTRIAQLLERGGKPDREQQERTYAAMRGLPQQPFFAGAHGLRVLLQGAPQTHAIWFGEGSVQVPQSHLAGLCDVRSKDEAPMVVCRCGTATVLTEYEARACVGACGRWFLALPSGVRARKFDNETEAEAA